MTRTPYDQFAKSYLEELLSRVGKIEPNRPIKSEVSYADIWFLPSSTTASDRSLLGLLGRLMVSPCLVEPFYNPVDASELRDCLGKLLSLHRELRRQAKREKRSIPEAELPKLWILSPSVSVELREAFGAVGTSSGEVGIYECPIGYRTGIIHLNQLPHTEDTLWLRLLSRGRVQEQAIAEVNALPEEHPLKERVLELLADLRTMLEEQTTRTQEEEELIVRLSAAYQKRKQEWKEEAIAEGLAEGRAEGLATGRAEGLATGKAEGQRVVIENLLKARFGELDNRLITILDAILQLPPEEYAPLLLQRSREELLAQFESQAN